MSQLVRDVGWLGAATGIGTENALKDRAAVATGVAFAAISSLFTFSILLSTSVPLPVSGLKTVSQEVQ